MAILIPDSSQIRITTKFEAPHHSVALPNALLDTAMTNPGPISVSLSGGTADPSNQARVTPAVGAAGDAGYIGYQDKPKQSVGSPVSAKRHVIVDGFTGVVPGSAVYIDATGADATSTASGLTHTAGSQHKIGVGWTVNRILFF